MQCKCGGNMIQSTHTVTTQKGVSKWTDKAVRLPAKIHQDTCNCTRTIYTVTDCNNIIVDRRG